MRAFTILTLLLCCAAFASAASKKSPAQPHVGKQKHGHHSGHGHPPPRFGQAGHDEAFPFLKPQVRLIIAYMDEEIAPQVKELVELQKTAEGKAQCRSIHVLERHSRVKGDNEVFAPFLFQRHVSHYGANNIKVFQVGPGKPRGDDTAPFATALQDNWKVKDVFPRTADAAWTDAAAEQTPFEKSILDGILKHYMNTEFAGQLAAAKIGGKSKCDVNFPELVLYRLGEKEDSEGDAKVGYHCVLFRAPEMGLQPNMAQKIFVHGVRSFEGMDVEYYASGAGGAANSDRTRNRPGCAHDVTGSFFIGALDEKPTIKSFELGDTTDGIVGKVVAGDIPAVATQGDAVTAARNKFHTMPNLPDTNAVKRAMKAFVLKIKGQASAKAPDVDTTENWFLGFNDKTAADAVGSVGANMEDTWVISAFNELRKNSGKPGFPTMNAKALVLRSDADPYNVENWVTSYNAWRMAKTTITKAELVEILMWSFKMDVDNAPAAVCWTDYVGTVPGAPPQGAFVLGKTGGGADCVNNGLHTETAADIWADGIDIKPMQKAAQWAGAKVELTRLAEECKTKKEAVFTAVEAFAGPGDITTNEAIKVIVTEFVGKFAAFMNVGLEGGLEEAHTAKPTLPFWIRDKWPVDAGPFLHLNAFNAENVDRVFYKSSNQPLMVRVAKETIAGGVNEANRARFGNEFPMAYWIDKTHAATLLDETCALTNVDSFPVGRCNAGVCNGFLEITSRLTAGMSFLQVQETLGLSDSEMAYGKCCHESFAHNVESQLGMLRSN